MLPEWISQQEILQQVGQEYGAGFNAVRSKRDLFRDRLDLYVNIGKENKIYVRLIFSTIQTLLALFYKDDPTIKFLGRQIGDHERAQNLERLKEFDYEEMWLDMKKFWVNFHKLFYGVGIEVSDWWDSVTQTPKVRYVDPLSWIPDPNADGNTGYQYHGFEMRVKKSDLHPRYWYFNTGELKTDEQLVVDKYIAENLSMERSMQQILNDQFMKDNRHLLSVEWSDHPNTAVFSVYQHYTTLSNWKKYIITTANDIGIIIKIVEILPVFQEEKADPNKIEFPVVVRHYSPLEGDSFWVCVPDLLEDKQKMKQLFMNLNRIKAENEALGDIFFYDEDVIDNINDLKVPSIGPKYVKANLSKGNTPMMEVAKARIKQDAYNMPEILEQQWFQDIGLDEASLWTSPSGSRTATEHQRVQRNANLRLDLGLRLDKIAEKKFWKILWYRMYVQYFKWSSKKIVYLNNWVGLKPVELNKDQFITSSDINVKVYSDIEAKEIKEKQSAMYMANIQFILNDPSTSKASKNFALRKLYTLWGATDEEANILVQESSEEMNAKLYLELLDRNEMPPEIDDMDEDHMAYIVIYQQALNTDAKFKAIEARRKALQLSGQSQPAVPTGDANVQSQMTSNAIAKSNSAEKMASSLVDIR